MARRRCCWRCRVRSQAKNRRRSHSTARHWAASGPRARRLRGLASVPEERNGHAAVPDFTLSDNSVLTARDRLGLAVSGLIRPRAARKYTGEVIEAFAVKATGSEATAGSLSGGNLQKYIMGREILQKPSVLVVSQPTWGVDAGAAAAIHQAIVDLAVSGSAVVVISQDLDELLSLCDTLAVINDGRLSTPMPGYRRRYRGDWPP